DNNQLSGCETRFDDQNCGACGASCMTGEFCSKGKGCKTCAPKALGSTLPLTVSGTTVGNADLFEPSCFGGMAPDAAYLFTAPTAADYSFDTAGSSFSAVLEIHDATCGGATL